MGAILGRQSHDCGRSHILVYGSLVQELLNDSIDANMIIIESQINFCTSNFNISLEKQFYILLEDVLKLSILHIYNCIHFRITLSNSISNFLLRCYLFVMNQKKTYLSWINMLYY